jgi:2-polyprenyl-3-methyl-5-hydroxy-6-metoxy-1,4-benzoquinol methylase
MDEKNKLIPITNGFGWTSAIPNQITVEFLKFIGERRSLSPIVIDIGVGLGVAALPALRAGAVVVANDISEAHLNHVCELATAEGFSKKIRPLNAALPKLPEIKGLSAVHCSNVLHFLSSSEIREAAKWMFNSTMPGGRIFIQTLSPYAGHFQMYLPIYESRKQRKERWPGEISGAKNFVIASLRDMTPDFMHVMEIEYLSSLFSDAGFEVIYCDYYSRHGLPEPCRLDGRENLGLISVRR